MSNIVVDAEAQVPADVEISNVDDSTITDTTASTAEEIMDQVAEAVDAPEAEESPEIPSKFAGKSTQEIIDSYTNLEKELGRKAQEVGELRKLSDSFLQAEVSRNTQNPQDNTPLETKDNDVDFFDDPNKAVNDMIENHPKFREFQQFQAQQAQAGAEARLKQTHPDFTEVVQDKAFQEWVQDSPIRMQMFQAADAYNFDAANELLTNWKDRSMISKTQEVKEKAEVERKEALKAGTAESRTSSGSSKGGKTFRRADLIRLKMENPSRYESLQDEIYAAYAEGRVV
tara:strand:- start:1577 stop:2434 length:858 start_codon:yes stop_codon:yes gene_type:complete